jgi:hypothetical protein
VHLWSHAWLPPWVQKFNQQKRRLLKLMFIRCDDVSFSPQI